MTYRIGECGGSFTTPKGLLTSPLYPNNYPDNADCVYTISLSKGNHILLTFQSMDIQDYDTGYEDYGSCSSDYLEIRDVSSDGSSFLDRFCGREIPDPIKSKHSQLWMK